MSTNIKKEKADVIFELLLNNSFTMNDGPIMNGAGLVLDEEMKDDQIAIGISTGHPEDDDSESYSFTFKAIEESVFNKDSIDIKDDEGNEFRFQFFSHFLVDIPAFNAKKNKP